MQARSSSFIAYLLMQLLLLLSGRSLARNFMYASELSSDEYRHYKNGFPGGTVGTLFMHYPAQVFSCDLSINYNRYSSFKEGVEDPDVFEESRKSVDPSTDDYFGFTARELYDTWSSCYQNFVTRYCMNMVTTTDRLFINRVRMCKHMYFPKTPDNIRPVEYLVREVKPYINFHMYEHIITNDHADTFSSQNLYPLGLEYLFDWNYMGYASWPEVAYKNINEMQITGYLYTERIHGPKSLRFAQFTLLGESWIMKTIQMVHEILWTSVHNFRGLLTHELTNAYKDFDHVRLHYLTHVCTNLLTREARNKVALIKEAPDIFTMDMCPNPCREQSVCTRRPHTSGSECSPIGLGTNDFRCECMAGFAWNQQSLSCDESFDCNRDCVSAHTRYCSFVPAVELSAKDVGYDRLTSREGHLRCECYPEFEGEQCQRRRNACNTGAEGQLSGNDMCRVDFGGNCTPTIGSSHYVCSCPKGYRSESSLREDNCLAKRTYCDSVICANNGECFSSLDGANFECLCTPGFEGRLCETPIVYQWTYWSDWSACDSLCGQGWQVSYRTCWDRQVGRPDSQRRCQGNNETLKVCHKHCLTEIQASHHIAIGLMLDLLFRMGLSIVGSFLFVKIMFDSMFRETDYIFVRYLRTVLLDLVKRAVGARQV